MLKLDILGRGSIGEELVDDGFVSQRGYVADVAVIHSYFSQDSTHDLAGTCLGEAGGVLNHIRLSERS